MHSAKVQSILDNLTPAERRELNLAKRLLVELAKGRVRNFGGIFLREPFTLVAPIKLSQTEMHDAVRCLQRLGYGVDRVDAGGSPTWELTSVPK